MRAEPACSQRVSLSAQALPGTPLRPLQAKAEMEAQQIMQREQLEQAATHSAQLKGELAHANSGSAAREEVERYRQEAEAANAKVGWHCT